jgi:flavin-dependent dehydrogenase
MEKGLPGYAWYLPKKGGWINIGIGGKQHSLTARKTTIMDHWRTFVRRLMDKGFLDQSPGNPSGHTYYLRHAPYHRKALENGMPDNLFVIGDAAGLSTLDMGEGIHAAVQSGIAAADAIISGRPVQVSHISWWPPESVPFNLWSRGSLCVSPESAVADLRVFQKSGCWPCSV